MEKRLKYIVVLLLISGCSSMQRIEPVSLPSDEVPTAVVKGDPVPFNGIIMQTGTYQRAMECLDEHGE